MLQVCWKTPTIWALNLRCKEYMSKAQEDTNKDIDIVQKLNDFEMRWVCVARECFDNLILMI